MGCVTGLWTVSERTCTGDSITFYRRGRDDWVQETSSAGSFRDGVVLWNHCLLGQAWELIDSCKMSCYTLCCWAVPVPVRRSFQAHLYLRSPLAPLDCTPSLPLFLWNPRISHLAFISRADHFLPTMALQKLQEVQQLWDFSSGADGSRQTHWLTFDQLLLSTKAVEISQVKWSEWLSV